MWNPLGIVGVITAFNFPCAVLGKSRNLEIARLYLYIVSISRMDRYNIPLHSILYLEVGTWTQSPVLEMLYYYKECFLFLEIPYKSGLIPIKYFLCNLLIAS